MPVHDRVKSDQWSSGRAQHKVSLQGGPGGQSAGAYPRGVSARVPSLETLSLEGLKDGQISSGKYESCVIPVMSMHVVEFSNSAPRVEMMLCATVNALAGIFPQCTDVSRFLLLNTSEAVNTTLRAIVEYVWTTFVSAIVSLIPVYNKLGVFQGLGFRVTKIT
jgi:hypothetical protein